MHKRQLLSYAIGGMLSLLLVGFVYVLFAGLSSRDHNPINSAIQFDVPSGKTEIRRYQGQRTWITHLLQNQVTELRNVDLWVINSLSGCEPQQVWCLVQTKTQKQGIEIQFTNARPPSLKHDTPWVGGYVNPNNGAVYDLLGRAYKNNPSNATGSINVMLNN